MSVDRIRRLAEEEQIPVLGFGPASDLAGELPGHRPEDLLPGARTLVCFGLPVPAGVYGTPRYNLETVWHLLQRWPVQNARRHASPNDA